MRFYPEEAFQRDLCTGCGTCLRLCPSMALVLDGSGRVQEFRSNCINCGHCGAYCPVNAFGLKPVSKGSSPEALISLFSARRSTRLFVPVNLTEERLSLLLRPVGYAPTGTNSQGITVVAIQGVDRIQAMVVDPVRRFLRPFLPLASRTGFRHQARDFADGGDPITRRAPCLLFFFVPRKNTTPCEDGVIAATMVSLQAEAMGLGCLWNGVVKILFPFLGSLRKFKPRGAGLRAVLCVGERQLEPLHEVPGRDCITVSH